LWLDSSHPAPQIWESVPSTRHGPLEGARLSPSDGIRRPMIQMKKPGLSPDLPIPRGAVALAFDLVDAETHGATWRLYLDFLTGTAADKRLSNR
jgi:hypothetical protein